jgi:hypothetical protein
VHFLSYRLFVIILSEEECMTTEIYAHLSDKHLYHVVSLPPPPNIVTVLVTPDFFFVDLIFLGRIFSFQQIRGWKLGKIVRDLE